MNRPFRRLIGDDGIGDKTYVQTDIIYRYSVRRRNELPKNGAILVISYLRYLYQFNMLLTMNII